MQEPGPPHQTAGFIERVRQSAQANLQLLAMLEVVQEWTSADAMDLAEAAEQTDAGLAARVGLSAPATLEEARVRAQADVERVRLKLERLSLLAPLQSRDPAVVKALQEGLRRLRTANDSAETALQTQDAPLARRRLRR